VAGPCKVDGPQTFKGKGQSPRGSLCSSPKEALAGTVVSRLASVLCPSDEKPLPYDDLHDQRFLRLEAEITSSSEDLGQGLFEVASRPQRAGP